MLIEKIEWFSGNVLNILVRAKRQSVDGNYLSLG